MLGYYIHNLNPFIWQWSEAWGLRWYGFSYLLGFVCAYFIYKALAKRGYSQMKPEQVGDYIFTGALLGVIVGGRLGYMLFYGFERFIENPLIFFAFHEGGMSAHGGIAGFMIFSAWFAWRHSISWLNTMDNLAVVAPLGIGFGRIANFINGELYGRATTQPWAVQFPQEIFNMPATKVETILEKTSALDPHWGAPQAVVEGTQHSQQLCSVLADYLTPRHPSQIYEALGEGFLLFALLAVLRIFVPLRNGVLAGLFLIGYAIARSLCEIFREPDAPLTAFFTRGQFLSLFLVVLGIAFLVASCQQPLIFGKYVHTRFRKTKSS